MLSLMEKILSAPWNTRCHGRNWEFHLFNTGSLRLPNDKVSRAMLGDGDGTIEPVHVCVVEVLRQYVCHGWNSLAKYYPRCIVKKH